MWKIWVALSFTYSLCFLVPEYLSHLGWVLCCTGKMCQPQKDQAVSWFDIGQNKGGNLLGMQLFFYRMFLLARDYLLPDHSFAHCTPSNDKAQLSDTTVNLFCHCAWVHHKQLIMGHLVISSRCISLRAVIFLRNSANTSYMSALWCFGVCCVGFGWFCLGFLWPSAQKQKYICKYFTLPFN